jgi:hypothetical protein
MIVQIDILEKLRLKHAKNVKSIALFVRVLLHVLFGANKNLALYGNKINFFGYC